MKKRLWRYEVRAEMAARSLVTKVEHAIERVRSHEARSHHTSNSTFLAGAPFFGPVHEAPLRLSTDTLNAPLSTDEQLLMLDTFANRLNANNLAVAIDQHPLLASSMHSQASPPPDSTASNDTIDEIYDAYQYASLSPISEASGAITIRHEVIHVNRRSNSNTSHVRRFPSDSTSISWLFHDETRQHSEF